MSVYVNKREDRDSRITSLFIPVSDLWKEDRPSIFLWKKRSSN